MKNQNKYLGNLTQVEINSLKSTIVAENFLSTDTEDWATKVGQNYVGRYGYPSQYDTYCGIGSSLIYALVPERNTPEWVSFWNGNFENNKG